MDFATILEEILTGLNRGFGGNPGPTSREVNYGIKQQVQAQAAQAGMTVEEFLENQRALAELQRKQLETSIKVGEGNVLQQAQEAEKAEALARYQGGGRAPGEVFPAMQEFVSKDRPDVRQFLAADQPRTQPGVYLQHPEFTRADAIGEHIGARQEFEDLKVLEQLDIGRAGATAADARIRQTAERLEFDRTREERYSRQAQKQMELIDARIADIKDKNPKPMSIGQAMQIAYQMTGEEAGDDEQAGLDTAALADQLMRYANNPGNLAAAKELRRVVEAQERRRGRDAFDDNIDEPTTDLRRSIGDAYNEAGESMGERPPQEGPDIIELPPKDGAKDSRWLDRNTPLPVLLGLDERAQQEIQRVEVEQDQAQYEEMIRQLGALGVPFDEWPAPLKTFVETMKNPEAAQGLVAQPR